MRSNGAGSLGSWDLFASSAKRELGKPAHAIPHSAGLGSSASFF